MTTRAEFVEKAAAAGMPADKIKSAMELRRSKIGAFDDDPSGPTTGDKIMSVARPILEGAGMAGGAAVAAAIPGAGPLVAPAAGALGFAGGKAAADLIDRVRGAKEPLGGVGEAIKEVGSSIAEGAAYEALGAGMGAAAGGMVKGAKAGTEWFGKKVVQGAKAVSEQAAKYGVDLSIAEATKSKGMAMLESALDKLPWSGGMIHKFKTKQTQQLDAAAQDLIDNLANAESKEAVGTAAQESIKKKMFKRMEVRDRLYARLEKIAPKGKVVETNNLAGAAQELLEKENALPQADRNPKIIEYLEGKIIKGRDAMLRSPESPEKITFPELKSLRERFNSLIGPVADTPEKQVYKRLKGALDQDLAAFVEKQGGDLEVAYRAANRMHGAIKQLADDPNVKSIVNKANPGAIVDSILKSKNTLQLTLLRKAMPEESYQKVQGAIVDRLFERGINQSPAEALASNLKQYGDEFLEKAITKPKLDRLKDFAKVVETIKAPDKMAGNVSGTARVMISTAQGSFLVISPVKGVIAIATPPILAKAYLSESGRNLITQGIKLTIDPANTASMAKAASIATALAAQINRIKGDEK